MDNSCSNPSCSEPSKSKCAACATVSYCGTDCQKAHWPTHKKACKAARAVAANSDVAKTVAKVSVASDAAAKLQAAKVETQQSFNTGDFTASVKSGNEALTFAKLLPEPASSIEAIQIHLNMTTAYMQLKRAAEAKIHSSLCVEVAERSLAIRKGEPQAVEMLVVALGCKSHVLMGDNKLDEADTCASRALALAEHIFAPNDVRLFKSIRAVGTIRDKQNRLDEAVALYTRAFDIVFEVQGPVHQETLQIIDELANLLIKKDDKNTAEILVRKCYDAAIGSSLDPNHLLIADAAGRLATTLAKCDKESEAEPYMKQALTIREKCLGANHPLVAVTLGFVAGIYEGQGKFGEETEDLLLRAMEIFRQVEGPQGAHVRTTLGHIQRIRMKRDGRYNVNSTIEEEDEDEEEIEEVTTKGAKKISLEQKDKIREMLSVEFHPNDGVGRMRHAAYCFELHEFSKAEVLLAEAYDIFLKDNGPTHPSTAAARQNLEVVRTNALNSLWQEVARDEIEKLIGNSASPSSPVKSTSPGVSGKDNRNPPMERVSTGDSANAVEEVTWCEPQQLSPEDEWLFRETPKAGQCTIC